MKKGNLDTTKPHYSQHIFPIPWTFIISRYHCSSLWRTDNIILAELNKSAISSKPPPPSNVFEINKPPGRLNRGFMAFLIIASKKVKTKYSVSGKKPTVDTLFPVFNHPPPPK